MSATESPVPTPRSRAGRSGVRAVHVRSRQPAAPPRSDESCRCRRGCSGVLDLLLSGPARSCRGRNSSTASGRKRSSPTRRWPRPSACSGQSSATTRRPDLHPDRPPARLPVRGARARLASPRRPLAVRRCRSGRPPPRGRLPSIGRQLVPWSIAVLCALLAASAVLAGHHAVRKRCRCPAGCDSGRRQGSGSTHGAAVALSPDGAQVAWAACDAGGCRLYVRPLDGLDARPLSGTEDGASPVLLAGRPLARLLRRRKAEEGGARRRRAGRDCGRGAPARSGVDAGRADHLRQLACRRAAGRCPPTAGPPSR